MKGLCRHRYDLLFGLSQTQPHPEARFVKVAGGTEDTTLAGSVEHFEREHVLVSRQLLLHPVCVSLDTLGDGEAVDDFAKRLPSHLQLLADHEHVVGKLAE